MICNSKVFSLRIICDPTDLTSASDEHPSGNQWLDIVTRFVVDEQSLISVLQAMQNHKAHLGAKLADTVVFNLMKKDDVTAIYTFIKGTEGEELMVRVHFHLLG